MLVRRASTRIRGMMWRCFGIIDDKLVIWCISNCEHWRIQNYEAKGSLKGCYHKYELLPTDKDLSISILGSTLISMKKPPIKRSNLSSLLSLVIPLTTFLIIECIREIFNK